jgi:hypothetical protein
MKRWKPFEFTDNKTVFCVNTTETERIWIHWMEKVRRKEHLDAIRTGRPEWEGDYREVRCS